MRRGTFLVALFVLSNKYMVHWLYCDLKDKIFVTQCDTNILTLWHSEDKPFGCFRCPIK